MRKPLTPREILRYERRLRDALASLADGVEAVERGVLEPSGGARFQDVDESVEEAHLAEEAEVLRVEDDLGYEVQAALERIARHTFGACEDCEQIIPRERLGLLPHERLCARCARAPMSVKP